MARSMGSSSGPIIEGLEATAYTVPTEGREADGTLAWDSTTIVVVEATAAGHRGLGYSYTHESAAVLAGTMLAASVRGHEVMAVPRAHASMRRAVRNVGLGGIAAGAISAVDAALWDLKSRLLDLPLVTLLGAVHESVPVYGSGGFTTYDVPWLQQHLRGYVDAGIPRVKMKVGSRPAEDGGRVRAAREAVGEETGLFVDANGAYDRKQALRLAALFAEAGVTWFEEPVSSDDLEGLRLLRDHAPPGMDIAAGEYGYDLLHLRRMLEAGAVDVLQADATRCLGITGFLQAAALCGPFNVPLSSHTAPALHLHACCAAGPVRHLEYFHDHVRLEQMLFDGVVKPRGGRLQPDLSRSGLGLALKPADAEPYRVR